MASKQLYLDRVEAQLKRWVSSVEILRKRAEEDSVAVENRLLRWIQRQKRSEIVLRNRIEEVVAGGRESIEDLGAGLRRAWSDLREVVERATSPRDAGRRPRKPVRKATGQRSLRARPATAARG